MKKLTKLHIILIILFVAVVAVSAFFMSGYQEAEARQPDIMDEINRALMRLEIVKEENDPTEFEQELEKLRSTINTLIPDEPLFPKQPATVEIGDLIIDSVEKLLPASYGYGLLSLSSHDKAGTVTIGDSKFNKAEYKVEVKGNLTRINSLIGEIEYAQFATLTTDNIRISHEEKTDTETGITTEWWEAQFTVVTLYQYEE